MVPMVALGSSMLGMLPSRVSRLIGTWSAIVLTLKPETSSATKRSAAASCASESTAGIPVELGAWDDAEVQRIERRTEIDVERIVGRAGEHPHPVVQVVDALAHQVRVVRHGPRPDVARHGEQGSWR